jgi:tight adherence protein C
MIFCKEKYGENLELIDKKEYIFKPFLPIAFFILDKIKYKYSTRYGRKLLNKYTEINGKKYAKFYTQIHIANKIVVVLVGITFIFFINSILALQQIELRKDKKNTIGLEKKGIIERPAFGEGNKEIQAEAELQNGKVKANEVFQVPLKEMPAITKDERAVAKSLEKLTETSLKGRNKNLLNINSNLTLPINDKNIGNLGVKIAWKSSNETFVKANGSVVIPQYGTGDKKIVLQAILSKGKALYKKNFKITVLQSQTPITDQQKVLAAKSELQKKIDERSKMEDFSGNLKLPSKLDNLDDLKINWLASGIEKKGNGITILFLGFVFLILVIFLADNELDKKIKKRRLRLQLDFPDFLNRFTLLINAGMTVSRAWIKISEDAAKGGPLYEEIAFTVSEINSGKAEIISYENFAERCKISEISKFVSVIEQNLRKGNKELVAVLKFQLKDCWQMRRNVAKRLGEEASTKMLFPLMLMFSAIILIVATPAVMAMQGF